MRFSSQTMLYLSEHVCLLSIAALWLSSASPSKSTATDFYRDDTRADLEAQLGYLRQKLSDCGCHTPRTEMKLHYVRNTQVTCNDQSKAGYYIRKSQGSRRWVIYLEGGAFCYDGSSCQDRKRTGPFSHVSSGDWAPSRQGKGILSANIERNPHWWNSNAVSVPYCSSDAWSGNQTLDNVMDNKSYVFMGSRIVQEVIRELLSLHGLGNASQILLTGSSVGGTGVMLNLDRVADILKNSGSQAGVYGLSDSGWYIDHTPRAKSLCNGKRTRCSASKTIRAGQRHWNGIVPDNCARDHPDKTWNCYFGEILYRYVKRPLFVTQYLYDEEQLKLTKLEIPHNDSDYERMLKIGKQVRKSLRNTRNLFAPACLAHELISKDEWKMYKIDGFTLPDAINCWLPKPGMEQEPHCQSKLIDNCTWPSCNVQCPDVITRLGSQRYDMARRYHNYLASQGKGTGSDRNDVQHDGGTARKKSKRKQA